MGSSYSFLDDEKKTWDVETIKFDQEIRNLNVNSVTLQFVDGVDIYLSHVPSTWGGIRFQHWFITDNTHFFEFGSSNQDIYDARVNIYKSPYKDYIGYAAKGTMNGLIRSRMRQVIGMSNYSLCLRNSEHVANYVFRERWVSFQMDDCSKGALWKIFQTQISEVKKRKVNIFPSSFQPENFNTKEKMYSFIKNNSIADRFDYYLDYDEDTFNILLLGPTGAGKSHLVNSYFNRKICPAEKSTESVTKEVYFIRGSQKLFNPVETKTEVRKIVVADTIGLCDKQWNDRELINLIKSRVHSNVKQIDAVLIVFTADRLSTDAVNNIKSMLNWLKYSRATARKFIFVGTHAEDHDDDEKVRMSEQLREIFKLHPVEIEGEKVDMIIYTGFPPENSLNDKTRENVINGFNKLNKVINNAGKASRLNVEKDNGCIFL